MDLARIIISILLAVVLVASGGGKVLGLPFTNGNRDALGVHPVFWRIIGVLELAAVVGLVWGIWFLPFGLAASIGVGLLMLGAIGFRIRTGKREVIQQSLVDLVVLFLAIVVIVFSALALK